MPQLSLHRIAAAAVAAMSAASSSPSPLPAPSSPFPPHLPFPPPGVAPYSPSPHPITPPPHHSLPPPSPHSLPPYPSPPVAPATESFCESWSHPHPTILSHLWFALVTVMPAAAFLAFLISRSRSSVSQLRRTQSLVIATYYILLWVATIANLVRSLLQVSLSCPDLQPTHPYSPPPLSPSPSPLPSTSLSTCASIWNASWIATAASSLFLESSVVIFLFQGFHLSGPEALLRTVLLSALLTASEAAIKAHLIFRSHLPLFSLSLSLSPSASKWAFWSLRHLLAAAVYAALLLLPLTRWRDRLPARPSFYRYVTLLCSFNAISCLASLLLLARASFAFCWFSLARYLYFALFPPLLYVTFLADFFRDEDAAVEEAYYSEMRDAGYFDIEGDWD